MIAGSALGELSLWQPPTGAQALLKEDFVAHLHEHDGRLVARLPP